LIAKQPVSLQRAWAALDEVIREQAQSGSSSPEPYLARSELWALATDYDAALEDLLEAMKVAQRQPQTTAQRLAYLTRFEEILALRVRLPRPRYPGEAVDHLGAGIEFFDQGLLDRALAEFDAAVQLNPADKVHWYYRALTQKRLLNDAAAERDVTVAVHLERQQAGYPSSHWLRYFIRVQGPLRNWMEDHRSGLATR
jgi:tetratricopeptide (TPR) repeat protein